MSDRPCERVAREGKLSLVRATILEDGKYEVRYR